MKIIIILSCFISTILNLAFAQNVYNLRVNDVCISHIVGQDGVCMNAMNCELFKVKAERDKMKICSFQQKTPIVCCPVKKATPIVSNIAKRISATKCDTYSELGSAPSTLRVVRSPKKAPSIDGTAHVTFVGGTKADFNEFPHMTAIGWKLDNNKTDFQCGGSLISEKFVLSAAHCASVGREEPDVVRIGDQDLLKNEEGIFPQEIPIKRIIVHPQYKNSLKYHDLALFELSNPVTFTKDVAPACLRQNNTDPSEAVEAMGYGQTSFAGPTSNALLKGFLTIVNNSQCNAAYGDDPTILPQGITQQQICAWDPDGNKDTCQGDSGGPLQVTKYTKTSKKYYEIIGVTSFGKFCAAGTPGVYVRVSSYLDWIESIVWQ